MVSKFRIAIALSGVIALMAVTGSADAAAVIKSYNSIPGHLPGNVVSVGFEATSASELGDEVVLADPTPHLRRVQVVMSSWACESGGGPSCLTSTGATFSIPMTLHIYGTPTAGVPGPLLVSQTRTVNLKYRPSANNVKCTGGRWWSKKDHSCYSGYAQSIIFAFPTNDPSRRVLLPTDIVWTVAFNTTHHGYNPIGEAAPCFSTGCPYDSLNVGTEGFPPGQPSKGTDVDPNGIYWNTSNGGPTGFYCDGGPGGTLRLDTNNTNDCWGTGVTGFPQGLTPLAQIKTS